MSPLLDRRTMILGLGGGAATLMLAACGASPAEAEAFPVQLSDAEWRRKLSPQAYAVLRKEATERPFSSPLDREKRLGVFNCAGCSQALFSSRTKFDSGTGWPSFWAPLRGSVGIRRDFSLGIPRTEVHCARCGGHLGHVFDDGPRPTGKRYCMNGAAMAFRPK
ncbi:peptide-methionine (R)-S-oxide reductase MsrB [Sphingomonas sp. IC4-52]|uniref:peptide-methionine (R)-S-oxide reductase MsrB n=1 Tax=Sphingomonas sp. IC4-52 TaxID=2887202 RepID=UPI001D124E32|nr:peptide-methionine (R)-S-oxide reductase MsrB [Sphingomonas sp. IC4-52]MCC2979311.1 peptide-methionine (R)-S-oxide reductase MsrB [Sphingomonas sp. IC4-52]